MDIKMVVTDLDGTLARSDSSICPIDIETLARIGQSGVCRVIATGRSCFSAQKVLAADFPIDYLVFSCGAGILDWKNKEIIHAQHLSRAKVEKITKVLLEHRVDFSIQDKIPNNHYFSYILHNQNNMDFKRRLAIYEGFSRPFDNSWTEASQIIAILGDDVGWFNELSRMFNDVKVIRATSPLDGRTIWMEFFPEHISKASGINYLCELLDIDREKTAGIGNDYNDLDFLDYCKYSFVVENAPEEIKERFPVVASNDMNGFTQLITAKLGLS